MRLVIFDLDNTLYDENQYFHAVFMEFCKLHHIAEKEALQAIDQTLQDQVRLESKDIFQSFLQATPLGFHQALHDELYTLYTQISCKLSPFEDATAILSTLQNQKIPFAILTNGSLPAQQNKIKNLDFQHFAVFFARTNGKEYEKPHAKAFELVLESFRHFKAKDCIFIGDHPHTDILGAKNIGMMALRLKRGYASFIDSSLADKDIVDLREVMEVL